MTWSDVIPGLVVPGLLGVGGFIAWLIRSKLEEYRDLQRGLVDLQRETYGQILDPFIQLFANLKTGGDQNGVMQQMLSKDYRKTTFDLVLFGSDEVVRAYNRMMQFLYTTAASDQAAVPARLMALWGELLREIRRSLGNKRTTLDHWEMLAGMFTDLESLKAQAPGPPR